MIGDSAGVGKGRQAAAIIMDNYARGRTKSLWVSTTGDLKLTAERDLRDIGCYVKVINGLKELDSLKASSQQTGVLFLTYATLASTARGKPRLEQVIKWLGGDRFDGPIIFDEAHKAKHFSEKGSSTKVASAVVSLQRRVPKGRVVYCSATGISEVQNVGYLDRLGLWGKGTSFEDSSDFIEHTKRKGLGFLELLSMELKAEGKYVARSLSFQSTEFREVKCVIDDGHKRHLYDQAARFWQTMRKSLNGDLERLGSEGEQINRHFWGVQQRFFKLLTLSLKVDTLIECVNSALQEGYAVVIGLQSTGEAALERNDCSDFVSTIRDMLRQFITEHWPTEQRAHGELDTSGPQQDGHTSVEAKMDLLEQVESLDLPVNFLDEIIDRLGGRENVAEMTGRRNRIVRGSDGKPMLEQRETEDNHGEGVNLAEHQAFMENEKKVAIISDAASTGISLHADPRAKNNSRRLHIAVELPFSADKAIQQLGRSHRTHQSSGPEYVLLSTSIGGEKRFAAAVAKRLMSLGALTRGDRRAASAIDLSSFNLDTPWGRKALRLMVDACFQTATNPTLNERLPPGVALRDIVPSEWLNGSNNEGDVKRQRVLRQVHEQVKEAFYEMDLVQGGTGQPKDTGDVRKLLNRMLILAVEQQDLIFNYFSATLEAVIRAAKAEGKFSEGVSDIAANSIHRISGPTTIHRPRSSILTTDAHLLTLDRGMSFAEARGKLEHEGRSTLDAFYKSRRNVFGRTAYILALQKAGSESSFAIFRPNMGRSFFEMEIDELQDKYVKCTIEEAQTPWDDIYKLTKENCIHGSRCQLGDRCSVGRRIATCCLITGSVIPLWGLLEASLEAHRSELPKGDQTMRVVRVQLEEGEKLIGIRYPERLLREVQERLELHTAKGNSIGGGGLQVAVREAVTPITPEAMSRAMKPERTIKDFFKRKASAADGEGGAKSVRR